MNCIHFEDWLRDSVGDRNRTVPAEAAAHLQVCPGCRTRWAGEQHLERAIAAWSHAPLPAPAAEAVVSELLEAAGRVPRTTWAGVSTSENIWRAWASLAAAVVVLAATGVALHWPHAMPRSTARVEPAVPAAETSVVSVSDSVASFWSHMQTTSRVVAQDAMTSLTHLPAVPPTVEPPERQPAIAAPAWLPFSDPFGVQVHHGFGFLTEALPRPPAG